MFTLHETTRRGLVRSAFVALCVMPTVGLAGWSAARYLPQYLAWHERQIDGYLGLAASLDAVENPRPGESHFVRLELRDPETGLLIAAAERVIVQTRGNQVSIELIGARLESGSLADAARALDRLMRRHDQDVAPHLRISAAELTVRADGSPLPLFGFSAEIDSLPVRTTARFSFRTDQSAETPAVALRVVRDRQASPPSIGYELQTGGVELPCALVSPLWDAAPCLGPRATFSGILVAPNSGYRVGELAIKGRLANVDLQRAIEAHFPRRLRGNAELTLASARFAGGRLVEAHGTLLAGPGQIDRELVVAVSQSLRLPIANRVGELPDLIDFQQLRFDFAVSSLGIALSAQRAAGESMAPVLWDSTSALLAVPDQHPNQPTTALVQALIPPTRELVPADDRASWLLRALPAAAHVEDADHSPPLRQ